jgi:hypothetical protein
LKYIKKRNVQKEVPAFFLDTKNDKIDTQEKIDLVISPSLYWFKEEPLPVKNATQAKKLLPAFFDGTIPDGSYSYTAIKHSETFWLFAYEDARIVEAVENAGVKPSQIRNIYFSQTELQGIEAPLKVDDSAVLFKHEENISKVAAGYMPSEEGVHNYLNANERSKHSIAVNLFQNSIIEEKYLYRLMVLVLLITTVYLISYIVLRQDYKQERIAQHLLQKKYQLPETSFERNGLKRSLEAKEKRQLKVRSAIKSIMSLQLKKGEFVKKVEITAKKVSLEIEMGEAKRAENFKYALQKVFTISSAKVVDKTFYIGGKL